MVRSNRARVPGSIPSVAARRLVYPVALARWFEPSSSVGDLAQAAMAMDLLARDADVLVPCQHQHSSFAYVLMQALRRLGARGAELARAQCSTLRRKLLKVGTRIRITARRVWPSFSQSYPDARTFTAVLANLQREPLWREPG